VAFTWRLLHQDDVGSQYAFGSCVHLEINPELSAPGLPQTAVAILVILPQKAQTRHTNPWSCLIKTGGWMVFNHEGIGFRTFV